MKIALVILHADPARGGAERYTVDAAAALARRGHDVSLLASSFGAPIEGVAFVDMPARGATRAGRYRSYLDALDAQLDRSNYDIVHAMLPVRRCDVYHPHAGVAAAAERKWNIHFNPRRKRMARVERELLTGPRPPITIALSEYVKRSIREHYPLPDERLATLFNAVNLNDFVPGRSEEAHAWLTARHGWPDEPVALMIAQDFERKGLRYAIGGITQVPEVNGLVVVGGGSPRMYQGDNEGSGHRVHFVGATHNPIPYYKQSDFFVLPTKHDPCSLVVLEALAMGLPVISTVFNGATEIMTEGVHGYVLKDPNDVDALADAMRKMMDADRRRAMREACLALRPKLSYEHHVDEFLRIYERAGSSSA